MNNQSRNGPFGATIAVDNVNEALPLGLSLLRDHGVKRVSRGIETIKMNGPVSTIYRTPTRRVLFDEVRDANPFFHLMESLWILGGSNRLALPAYYLNRYADFSDDGVTLHGAYGRRLRHWADDTGECDQIISAINLLRDKPDSRQVVMSIWDPAQDMLRITKDMPCNDMVMFNIEDGALDMQVCNRSNDAIWGAYGANAVQFSMLHEVIATAVGVEVGYYVQQSWNYHVYPSNPFWQKFLDGTHEHGDKYNPYMTPDVQPWTVAATPAEALSVLEDCVALCALFESGDHKTAQYQWKTDFFKQVVQPVMDAYEAYKDKDWKLALHYAENIAAGDWQVACTQWLVRRMSKGQA